MKTTVLSIAILFSANSFSIGFSNYLCISNEKVMYQDKPTPAFTVMIKKQINQNLTMMISAAGGIATIHGATAINSGNTLEVSDSYQNSVVINKPKLHANLELTKALYTDLINSSTASGFESLFNAEEFSSNMTCYPSNATP